MGFFRVQILTFCDDMGLFILKTSAVSDMSSIAAPGGRSGAWAQGWKSLQSNEFGDRCACVGDPLGAATGQDRFGPFIF